MVHVYPEHLGISRCGYHCFQNKIETVQVSAQEEIGWGTECEVCRVEEPASRSCSQRVYFVSYIHLIPTQQFTYIPGAEEVFPGRFRRPVAHCNQSNLLRVHHAYILSLIH